MQLLRFLLPILLLWSCTGPERPAPTAQEIMNRPEVQRVLFRPRAAARTVLPPGAADIDIEVAPGITIGCRLFTADKAAPTILFFHGNGEIVADYDDIGPLYMEAGLNFLVVDYRGYGWSGGSPSYANLLADSHVLHDQLKQYLQTNGYGPALFLMGRSLGSAAAIELASSHNAEISGLIIESGFALTLPLAETLGLGDMLKDVTVTEEQTFNNAGKISRVTKPTFLLHGQRDTLIPLWQAEKLHAESGARNKELQVVPGADHNSLIAVGGKHYFLAISRFVRQVTGADDWRVRRKQFKAASKVNEP
ncbi:alpha/beta hydrolase [Candidatus Electronema sp. TJ]|uniref:alpha/beta hydrolase n=1 Tax=Candidatus Electronema sp. TJ TaxID=3401573 RepID=UPI003AA98405